MILRRLPSFGQGFSSSTAAKVLGSTAGEAAHLWLSVVAIVAALTNQSSVISALLAMIVSSCSRFPRQGPLARTASANGWSRSACELRW